MIWYVTALLVVVFITTSVSVYSMAYQRGWKHGYETGRTLLDWMIKLNEDMLELLIDSPSWLPPTGELDEEPYPDPVPSFPYGDDVDYSDLEDLDEDVDPSFPYDGDNDYYGDPVRENIEKASRAQRDKQWEDGWYEWAADTAEQVEREEKAYGKTDLPHHGTVHVD